MVLQETHCTTADKLVILIFSPAGSVLSRNHDLATYVHERLEWSLVDQSPEQPETEWLCDGCRRRRIRDHQRLQTSTLAICTNGHLEIPTPQSICWWLQLPTCQLGLQQNIWQWEHRRLGNIQQPWLYNPKESASLFSLRWNVGTNPDLAFVSFDQDRRRADRRVLGKLPRSQHRPSLIMPPKLKVPVHSDPVKRSLIGSAFAFSQMNPLRDCHLWTHQILRGSTRMFVRAYFLRPNNVSHVAAGRTMCHAGTKSARPSIAPVAKPQWGQTLKEPLRPYYLGSGRRNRSDGRSPSTSRTLAARRGEQSKN